MVITSTHVNSVSVYHFPGKIAYFQGFSFHSTATTFPPLLLMSFPASFRLALVQMRVEGGEKKRNLERALKFIHHAAEQGAEVVLLPEALNLGWTHPAARKEADSVPESWTVQQLREAARLRSVYLCFGLVEAAPEGIYNSALLVDPEGNILLRHRKIHELDIARELYRTGNQLQTTSTPLACFGIMICADAFAPGQVISRSLALMGANVILSPSSWAVPPDHDQLKEPYGQLWLDNYQPVAREHKLWIASASNVGLIAEGPWKGRHCIGCSMVIGPDGTQQLAGPYGISAEEILYLTVSRVDSAQGWIASA
jgi:predicted amidohydrolase